MFFLLFGASGLDCCIVMCVGHCLNTRRWSWCGIQRLCRVSSVFLGEAHDSVLGSAGAACLPLLGEVKQTPDLLVSSGSGCAAVKSHQFLLPCHEIIQHQFRILFMLKEGCCRLDTFPRKHFCLARSACSLLCIWSAAQDVMNSPFSQFDKTGT